MVWREIKIKTWHELIDQIELLKSNKMIYRGQTRTNYNLESSLKREQNLFSKWHRGSETTEQMLIRLEKNMVNIFKSEAHLYYENGDYGGLGELEILSMIQHYGGPTRLLDWSYSPYISTYFAINNNFDDDSVLYALDLEYITKLNDDKIQRYYNDIDKQRSNLKALNPIDFGRHYADLKARSERKGDSFTEEVILVSYEPDRKNIRLARQHGLFLVSSKIDINYEQIIETYKISEGKNNENEDVAIRFIIDGGIKLEILRKLQLMNISSEILFPEMEGYCKGLKYKLFND